MRSWRGLGTLAIFISTGIASAAVPSNDEQYFLEITNRMRLNPSAELGILTNINPGSPATWMFPRSDESNTDNALQYFNTDPQLLTTQWANLVPAPPLAWNSNLHDAALYHANRVIAHRFDPVNPDGSGGPQQHEFTGEPTLGQRFNNAGYTGWNTGAENLYAYAHNNFHGHAGFALDWGNAPGGIQNPPGHRNNIMNAAFRETGVAIVPYNEIVGPLIINMDFGARPGVALLTGVAFSDNIDFNHFYTPGEGLGGITVQVFNAGTQALRGSTTTWSAGGYVLQLQAGTYDVKLSGAGLGGDIIYRNVVMGSNNVKIDSLSTWLPAIGGSWTSAANWNAGVPNGIGTRAFISSYTGVGGAIAVNSAITVGHLEFDSNGAFTLSGSGSITLDVASGPARISSVGFNHNIATPIILTDDTTISVNGDLAFTGGIQNPSGRTISRAWTGTLRIAGPQTHGPGAALNIASGTVRMQSDAGTAASVASAATANLSIDVTGIGSKLFVDADQNLRNLTIAHGGSGVQSVDLMGHALHIYAPTLASAKSSLYAAMKNAALTPFDGIYDSTLASHVNAGIGLGIVADAHGDSHLLIRPTRIGDLNLDGSVTISDFIDLASNFNTLGSATWQEGDLNLDGSVTISDFIDLASNFNTSYSGEVFPINPEDQRTLATFAASIGASVPEPSAVIALLVGGIVAISRRRRR
jgi:uncharacterized protein YkwD